MKGSATFFVYRLYNVRDPSVKTGGIYLGVTNNLKIRLGKHVWEAKTGITQNPHKINSMRLVGIENVRIEAIRVFSYGTKQENEKDAYNEEELIIEFYREADWHLTNIHPGGRGGWSHLSKEQLGWNKGTHHSPEICAKISFKTSGKNNPRYGVVVSKETCCLISKRLKGRIPWNKGQKMSDEARHNMSLSAKNRKKNENKSY